MRARVRDASSKGGERSEVVRRHAGPRRDSLEAERVRIDGGSTPTEALSQRPSSVTLYASNVESMYALSAMSSYSQ